MHLKSWLPMLQSLGSLLLLLLLSLGHIAAKMHPIATDVFVVCVCRCVSVFCLQTRCCWFEPVGLCKNFALMQPYVKLLWPLLMIISLLSSVSLQNECTCVWWPRNNVQCQFIKSLEEGTHSHLTCNASFFMFGCFLHVLQLYQTAGGLMLARTALNKAYLKYQCT